MATFYPNYIKTPLRKTLLSILTMIGLFSYQSTWAISPVCSQLFKSDGSTASSNLMDRDLIYIDLIYRDQKTGKIYQFTADETPKIPVASLAKDPEVGIFAPGVLVDFLARPSQSKPETVMVSTAALRRAIKNLGHEIPTEKQIKIPILIKLIGRVANLLGYNVPIYKHLHARIISGLESLKKKRIAKRIANDSYVELPLWYLQILRVVLSQYQSVPNEIDGEKVDGRFYSTYVGMAIENLVEKHIETVDNLKSNFGVEVNVDLQPRDFERILDYSPQTVALLQTYMADGLKVSIQDNLASDFKSGEIVEDLQIKTVTTKFVTEANYHSFPDRMVLNLHAIDDLSWNTQIVRHELSHRQFMKSKPTLVRGLLILRRFNGILDDKAFSDFVHKMLQQRGVADSEIRFRQGLALYVGQSLKNHLEAKSVTGIQREMSEFQQIQGLPIRPFNEMQVKKYSQLIDQYFGAKNGYGRELVLWKTSNIFANDLIDSLSALPKEKRFQAIFEMMKTVDFLNLMDEMLAHRSESRDGRRVDFESYFKLNPTFQEVVQEIMGQDQMLESLFEDPKPFMDYHRKIKEGSMN